MPSHIKRTLESVIKQTSDAFKVLLLSGPRQVGKTTLLQEVQKKKRSYVTLDDLNERIAAQQDPASFIDRLQLPVLIDEVQYAPNLFSYIKIKIDQEKQPGLFWLTGSQQFEMMKNVTESLAGRVAILNLQGISLAEEQARRNSAPFLPELALLKNRQKQSQILTLPEVYHKIWRGSYPDMVVQDGKNWERFYGSYVSTYIQRDVQNYLNIRDTAAFHKFMQIAAARTGQLINYTDMARDVGVSEVTVKSWLYALEASGIVYQLQPYFNNRTKRLIKTPKLYFMDTGLCVFLSGWLTADVLERGAMAGAILETYAVSEIIKSYLHNGRRLQLYFYRDKEKREVDLLIEQNGTLYPVEIKKTGSIQRDFFKGFDFLAGLNMPIGHGCVLCFVNSLIPLSKEVDAVPIGYL
ncbi:MAG: ATP-binding protein [Gammaproteobacteria bacterium]|jgi:predicted AAA+ superfamily ATPase|nr:ATP-binding protein [Gammaproteobacteria bacterium]